jgi:hypothetical protein
LSSADPGYPGSSNCFFAFFEFLVPVIVFSVFFSAPAASAALGFGEPDLTTLPPSKSGSERHYSLRCGIRQGGMLISVYPVLEESYATVNSPLFINVRREGVSV